MGGGGLGEKKRDRERGKRERQRDMCVWGGRGVEREIFEETENGVRREGRDILVHGQSLN